MAQERGDTGNPSLESWVDDPTNNPRGTVGWATGVIAAVVLGALLVFAIGAARTSEEPTVGEIVDARPATWNWCEAPWFAVSVEETGCALLPDGAAIMPAGVPCVGGGVLFRLQAHGRQPQRFVRPPGPVINGGSSSEAFVEALAACDPTVEADETTASPATLKSPDHGRLYGSIDESIRVEFLAGRHSVILDELDDTGPGQVLEVSEFGEFACDVADGRFTGDQQPFRGRGTLIWLSNWSNAARDEIPDLDTDAYYALLVDAVRGWCPERLHL